MPGVTLLPLLVLAAAPAASKAGERVTIGFIDDPGNSPAIGRPRPVTLAALDRWLPQRAERGIRLIPPTTRPAQIAPEAKP